MNSAIQRAKPENYCTHAEGMKLYKSIIPRNREMIASIQKWQKEGKRVWVDAGAAHLLQLIPQVPEATLEISKFLKIQRYSIITSHELYNISIKSKFNYINMTLKCRKPIR